MKYLVSNTAADETSVLSPKSQKYEQKSINNFRLHQNSPIRLRGDIRNLVVWLYSTAEIRVRSAYYNSESRIRRTSFVHTRAFKRWRARCARTRVCRNVQVQSFYIRWSYGCTQSACTLVRRTTKFSRSTSDRPPYRYMLVYGGRCIYARARLIRAR